MTKKTFLILVLASVMTLPAWAQSKITSKRECTRRCGEIGPPKMLREPHEQKMNAILARLQAEADPEKRKAIELEREEENERLADAHRNVCMRICAKNPDD